MQPFSIIINGKRHEVLQELPSSTMLSEYLRENGILRCRFYPFKLIIWFSFKVGLTGTKVGCNEGGCGSCVVLVTSIDEDHKIVYPSFPNLPVLFLSVFLHLLWRMLRNKTVNSCLQPVHSLEGVEITNIFLLPLFDCFLCVFHIFFLCHTSLFDRMIYR